jgi:hypothetical protein
MKTITTAVAAVMMLGAGAVSATQVGAGNPYTVQPHEVRNLNKAPSAADISMICENKANFRQLSGSERTDFLASCNKDI